MNGGFRRSPPTWQPASGASLWSWPSPLGSPKTGARAPALFLFLPSAPRLVSRPLFALTPSPSLVALALTSPPFAPARSFAFRRVRRARWMSAPVSRESLRDVLAKGQDRRWVLWETVRRPRVWFLVSPFSPFLLVSPFSFPRRLVRPTTPPCLGPDRRRRRRRRRRLPFPFPFPPGHPRRPRPPDSAAAPSLRP